MKTVKDTLDMLRAEYEELERKAETLGTIRATLLVNYGEDGRVVKGLINQDMDVINMLMTVLEHYYKKGGDTDER